jgi:ketosteroid isomerase-like protein
MKRISGNTCAMMIVALSLGLTGVARAAESGKKEHDQVQANLKRFDQLDFEAYSERKNMKLFREIHCPDVKVVFPDGRTTEGIEQHVADINNLFNGTPDNRITAHPIAFGSGEWTVTTGVMEATFSEPMKFSDGKTIAATGKKVKMPMATIARWKKGCIAEEHLFWDNAEYMKQLGLPK